ncbi:MAG: Gfo/Idh/MocA family oxidoreductase [Candidatus Omnitrophica bacterium]|nr:Gfo/Idh/MocA family oxidoreductase [Candidatus Omnitrophota bacterium]
MVNWGVIGCGGIARRRTIPEGIVPAQNSCLTAVMDANLPVAKEMAKDLKVKAYDTEEELLADPEIQAIYIATPASLHANQAIAALRAGKDVLVEKPLCLTLSDCESVIREAEKQDRKLGVGYMMRFHGFHQQLKVMVSEGRIGKPVLGRAQLSCWYPPMEGAWRQNPEQGGGGSLIDMGNHLIDLLEYVFQSLVAEISCFTGNLVQSYPAEDSALTTVRFQNGALGMVDSFFSIPDNSSRNFLEVYGSVGSVLAEGTIGQGPAGTARAFVEKEMKGYEADQKRAQSGGVDLKFPLVNTYQAEIEEFADAILKDRKPVISGEDGLWSQKLVLAAYESARTGRTIKL